jgi:hypothetical protein
MRIVYDFPKKEPSLFAFFKQTILGKITHLFKVFYYKKPLGFNDVCTKPLNTATLLAIIHKHVSP